MELPPTYWDLLLYLVSYSFYVINLLTSIQNHDYYVRMYVYGTKFILA